MYICDNLYVHHHVLNTIAEERGVSNEFAGQLADWCTAHEHSQYINLLQEIEKFAKM